MICHYSEREIKFNKRKSDNMSPQRKRDQVQQTQITYYVTTAKKRSSLTNANHIICHYSEREIKFNKRKSHNMSLQRKRDQVQQTQIT